MNKNTLNSLGNKDTKFLCYTDSILVKKKIAEEVGKDKSVISRELKRNANNGGRYSFEYAQEMANLRKERNKNLENSIRCSKKDH